LPITFDGPELGPVMFFLHGWPDDETLWEEQIDYYSKKGWRCARVTLPHFARKPYVHHGRRWRGMGYNFNEMTDMLSTAIITAQGSGPPPVLVAHDFGSSFALLLLKKYPFVAKALVLLDVAAVDEFNIGREPTFANYDKLFAFGKTYQYALLFGFGLRQIPLLGDWLASKSPVDMLSAYPYWYLHMDHLLHALLRPFHRWLPEWQTSPIEGAFPPCPTLFVYGNAKPYNMMYHDPDYPDELRSRGDGSNAVAFDSGHYPMTSKDMLKDFEVPDDMRATLLKPGDADKLHKIIDTFLSNLAEKDITQMPN